MRTLWDVLTCFVISSCSSRGKVENVSNFVPMRKGIAVWCSRVMAFRVGLAYKLSGWDSCSAPC